MPQSTVVLMGDHVTALPLESFQHCPVDYVITGGDYDFMLLNLADHLTKKTPLEPGFYYRHRQSIKNSGKFALKHHQLDLLPIIDRQLTKWKLYSDNNTNFKYRPGAYIMSGRDCWWGKCTFCSWTTIFPSGSYRHFSVDHTVNEITNLVENFGAREIFDDSGTIPVGTWLNQLCHRLIETGLNRKVVLGCNLRFSSLTPGQYKLLKQAGFRFILYGLESANQSTLNRIHKNIKITDFKKTLNYAKSAGLEPHITIMIGYPWESLSDIKNTLNLAKNLFHHGLVDSLQATLVIPYPGTPLYKYCRRHRLLLTQNWTDFDMRQPVIRSSLSSETLNRLIISFYQSVITPRFILHKFLSIRNINDIKHLAYYAYKFLKKLRDFPRQTKN